MRRILAKMAPFALTNIYPSSVNVNLVGRDRHARKVSERETDFFQMVTFVLIIELSWGSHTVIDNH